LQPLRWRCVECAVDHEQDVWKEQHPYISAWANFVVKCEGDRLV